METLPFIYPISKQPPYRHFSRTTEHAEDRPAKRIKLESSDKVQESAITTLKNANLGGRFGCDCNLSVWSLPLNPSMSQDFSKRKLYIKKTSSYSSWSSKKWGGIWSIPGRSGTSTLHRFWWRMVTVSFCPRRERMNSWRWEKCCFPAAKVYNMCFTLVTFKPHL